MILSDGTVPWLPRSNTRLLSKSLRQRQDLCHYLNGVQVHPGDIRNILPFLNLSHGSWCLAAAAALGCIPADAAPPVCSASPSPLPNSLLPVLSTPDSQRSRLRCSVSVACVAALSAVLALSIAAQHLQLFLLSDTPVPVYVSPCTHTHKLQQGCLEHICREAWQGRSASLHTSSCHASLIVLL